MFVITVDDSKIMFYNEYDKALKCAEAESYKHCCTDDGCVSYTISPRVVIHEIEMNKVYESDYLIIERYAIKKFNDFT